MKNYFKQVYYEMRHQKMMTWVSISGTAMAIFLVMTYFMADQLEVVEARPETHRSRMLYGGGFELESETMSMSSCMSYNIANRIFGNLEGIEKMTFTHAFASTNNVGMKGKLARPAETQKTDGNFWKVYDFKFIAGKPYDDADCHADSRKVVITRGLARKVYNKDDATGETLLINSVPYVVCGVVEDVNPSLSATFANLYMSFSPKDYEDEGEEGMGQMMVHLMMAPGVTQDEIKRQVKSRYDQLNAELAKEGDLQAVYHNAPHDAEHLATGYVFSNITPDLTEKHRTRYLVYALLLLVPAINLGSMMRGRLRHRVSEIGVRRAFGAKKSSILMQILGENFIITIAGGIIGLVASTLFMMFLSTYFFNNANVGLNALQYVSAAPRIGMLFTWGGFLMIIAACFVLNLVSAFLPAWKASRIQPAMAISKSRM